MTNEHNQRRTMRAAESFFKVTSRTFFGRLKGEARGVFSMINTEGVSCFQILDVNPVSASMHIYPQFTINPIYEEDVRNLASKIQTKIRVGRIDIMENSLAIRLHASMIILNNPLSMEEILSMEMMLIGIWGRYRQAIEAANRGEEFDLDSINSSNDEEDDDDYEAVDSEGSSDLSDIDDIFGDSSDDENSDDRPSLKEMIDSILKRKREDESLDIGKAIEELDEKIGTPTHFESEEEEIFDCDCAPADDYDSSCAFDEDDFDTEDSDIKGDNSEESDEDDCYDPDEIFDFESDRKRESRLSESDFIPDDPSFDPDLDISEGESKSDEEPSEDSHSGGIMDRIIELLELMNEKEKEKRFNDGEEEIDS